MSLAPEFVVDGKVASDEVGTPSTLVSAGKTRFATGILIFVTFLWGVSFPLLKYWQDNTSDCPGREVLSSASLIAARMILGLLMIGVFAPGLIFRPTVREHLLGGVIGATFFFGFLLQVIGIASTTPARSAFLTALASAWVPLLAWICWRTPIRLPIIVGLSLGVAGVAVLTNPGAISEWKLGKGDGLTLLASFLFTGQILLVDHLGRAVRPGHLTVGFFASAGLLASLISAGSIWQGAELSASLQWFGSVSRDPILVINVLVLTLFSTVLAFYWMNLYQPQISAGRAALIYLLEPVFASILSVILGHDPLTWHLVLGGCLILGGNLCVELPHWLPELRKQTSAAENLNV